MSANPYHSLLTHLASCHDSSAIDELFTALLTDKEQQEIANRIRIFDLLELGVGIATVSRGAKAMQSHDVSALLKTHRENTHKKDA